MRISFVTDLGQAYTVEIDPQMELENIMALLEAESGIPVEEQSVSYEGRELNDPNATMAAYNVPEDAMLLLRRKVTVAGRTAEQDAEMIRLQILGDPALMRELQQKQPQLAAAATNNPAQFAELLRQQQQLHQDAELARQRDIAQLNDDPFDVEAQRRIEEAIRQEQVMENLQHAIEYSPESFGKVTMLYIQVEVNGHPVKAFVDSGAQQTIMSPECAEACGIMRLLDTRFSGIAKGVGTARILGRVHSAQMKVSDLFLACAFTIMEGRDVDLLFGLDMLKAHQACIDLQKNVLRIQGREIPFLAEHELPDKARMEVHAEDELQTPQPSGPSSSSSAPSQGGHRPSGSMGGRPSRGGAPQFPGSGSTLGSAPASRSGQVPRPAPPQQASQFPENDVTTLVNLGVTREQAIRMLEAAGGNVEVAASLLF